MFLRKSLVPGRICLLSGLSKHEDIFAKGVLVKCLTIVFHGPYSDNFRVFWLDEISVSSLPSVNS